MRKLFIYGFGYSAEYFVNQFNDNFSKIVAYTRNKDVIKNGNKFADLIDDSNISKHLYAKIVKDRELLTDYQVCLMCCFFISIWP